MAALLRLFVLALVLVVTSAACSKNALPTAPTPQPREMWLRNLSGTARAGVWSGVEIVNHQVGQGILRAEVSFVPGPPMVESKLVIMEARPGAEHCDVGPSPDRPAECLVIVARSSSDPMANPKVVELVVDGLSPSKSKWVLHLSSGPVTVDGSIKFIGVLK